jgi:hypothetical protein
MDSLTASGRMTMKRGNLQSNEPAPQQRVVGKMARKTAPSSAEISVHFQIFLVLSVVECLASKFYE